IRSGCSAVQVPSKDQPGQKPTRIDDLTRREAQVLRLVAKGKQNKIIAEELNLSEHTVKLHIHHVIAKLGVHNRTEAAIKFLAEWGEEDEVVR
uniref:response regulator transcription factor n=1 Tax=Aestuariivita boseongensis TaxID=1470562 RepID=UPI000ADF3935